MNLIDPHTITPEVLRRAIALYCTSVPLSHRPHTWSDSDHDLGVDGRFNLSLLGRFIEEAVVLDAITVLKPSSDIAQIERIVRRQMEFEHTKLEYGRFITALALALGLSVVQAEALIRPIKRAIVRETLPMIRTPKEPA